MEKKLDWTLIEEKANEFYEMSKNTFKFFNEQITELCLNNNITSKETALKFNDSLYLCITDSEHFEENVDTAITSIYYNGKYLIIDLYAYNIGETLTDVRLIDVVKDTNDIIELLTLINSQIIE